MKTFIFTTTAIALTLTPMAYGQDSGRTSNGIGIEVGASLLGFYAAPSYDITDKLQIRGVFSSGNLSTTQDIDGNSVGGTVSTNSTSLMLDYFPFDGGMRISGGFTSGGYKLTGNVNSLTFNGITFSAPMSITLAEKSAVSPVLSLGFEGGFAGIAITTDVGLRFDSLQVSTTGQDALPNTAQFNTEIDRVNADLAQVGIIPVAGLGISYSF